MKRGLLNKCNLLAKERLSLIKKIVLSYYSRSELTQFEGAHKGQLCLICGNGYSVNLKAIESLGFDFSICVNRFHLCYDDTTFRPDYTVVVDHQMLTDHGREICSHAESRVFCDDLALSGDFDGAHFLPVVNIGEFKFRDLRRDRYISSGNSVIIAAIQLAYYMGAKQIFLYGVDHNFKIDQRDISDHRKVFGEGNHFIKNYRAGRSWFPPMLAEIEVAFERTCHFLDGQGVSILNLTPNSRLPFVPKRSLSADCSHE